jgi:glycosyltransferase involved in cell wall biosynthesis
VIDPAQPDFTSTPIAEDRAGFAYRPARSHPRPCLSIVTHFTGEDSTFLDTAGALQRQSLQEWEWLITADAAHGEDARRLAEQADVSSKARLLGDRRAALEHARGDFVLLLPAGDLLEPTAAEKWLWFLTSNPAYDCVDSFRVSIPDRSLVHGRSQGQRDLRRDLGTWAGVARRRALASDQARCATFEEYLLWSRRILPPDETPGQEPPKPKRRRRERAPRAALDSKPFENELEKATRRLLMIVPFVTTGGADKFSVDVVTQLSRRDWEVTVVTTHEGDNSWLPRIARLTPDVFTLPGLLQPSDYPRFLNYLVGSRRPDAILISNSLFAYAALPYLRRVARDTAIVDYLHSVVETWLDGGYPRLSVDRGACLDLQITSSGALKKWMVERGGEAGRIEACYIGTKERGDDARRTRAELGLPERAPIILYPCRLTYEKQPAVFARTLQELRRRGHAYQALVVGDGPYLAWLEAFVDKHGLDTDIQFLGYQPNERVRELMSVADCVFLPSKYEGISAVFYEAMAEGVPVVGADVGGQRELVAPDSGILIQPGEEEEEVGRYAEALARLLEDPAGRRTMGDTARARIEKDFTVERMGERMELLLERAIELAAARPRVAPTPRAARDAAREAITTARWGSFGSSVGPISLRLRHLVYRALGAAAMPVYRLGLRLGLHWLEPLKDRVFHALFPPSR